MKCGAAFPAEVWVPPKAAFLAVVPEMLVGVIRLPEGGRTWESGLPNVVGQLWRNTRSLGQFTGELRSCVIVNNGLATLNACQTSLIKYAKERKTSATAHSFASSFIAGKHLIYAGFSTKKGCLTASGAR